MEDFMLSKEYLLDVQVEDLKISVLLLRFFQDAESEQMSLHSVCIRQVHRSTWSW